MNNPEQQTFAIELLAEIVAVARNAGIYPPKHPMVTEPAEQIVRLLKSTSAQSPLFTIHIVNGSLYFNNQLLPEETLKYPHFIEFLAQREVSNFSFKREVDADAIARFFSILAEDKSHAPSKISLRRRIEEEQITGIDFDSLVALDMMGNIYDLVRKDSGEAAANSYGGAVGCLQGIEQDVVSDSPRLDLQVLHETVSSLIKDFLNDRDALLGIMSIKNYDNYLFHHSVNVAVTALLIANKLSLSEGQMKIVGLSGLLHDMGKLKVPREIITKPGKLDEAEWAIIRRHPIDGARILMRLKNIGDLPALAAFEHHAGFDLSGYPTLRGRSRPHILSRIINIADVYEAMTANRIHRPAQSVDLAVKVLLAGSGTQFDPLLVKLLLNVIGVFPPGSLVRLRNGTAAIVVEPNEDNPFFPKVRLINTLSSPPDSPVINTADVPSEYAITGVADTDNI
jgi:putative nucleotidyltransferase with HDIG domain